MLSKNPLTSWLTILGPMGPNYFLGYFELIVFILLIVKEKYGAQINMAAELSKYLEKFKKSP